MRASTHRCATCGPKVLFVSRTQAGAADPGKEAGKTTVGPGDVFQAQLPPTAFGGSAGVVQATLPNGDVIRSATGPPLPDTAAVREVASGKRGESLRDATVRGVHTRVLTARGPDGSTLQIAKPLTEVDDTLGRLRWILLAVTIGGVGVASGLGVGVSRAATRPLGRLTAAAERVTATGDLHHRIAPVADDEPGRLAAAFNAMLGALEASRDAQRQLVADASHELRTPLTSIRANVELLERAHDLPPAERAARPGLGARAARGPHDPRRRPRRSRAPRRAAPTSRPRTCVWMSSCGDAVQRARRHAPATDFTLTAEPCMVSGSRARLARAVGNLLDNAVKWGPAGAPVEVSVSARRGGRPRPRSGHLRGRPAPRLRSLLPRPGRPRATRIRARPGHRQARRRRARRQRRRRAGFGPAERACA